MKSRHDDHESVDLISPKPDDPVIDINAIRNKTGGKKIWYVDNKIRSPICFLKNVSFYNLSFLL